MAGSLNHITEEGGAFDLATIETWNDAAEALEECFDIIALLLNGDVEKMREVCQQANAPVPDAVPIFGKRGRTWYPWRR